MSEAQRRRLLDIPDLARCVERLDTGKGRRLVAPMRTILVDRAPGFEPGANEAEARWADVLVRAGLPAPVRQHPVVLDGARYVLDLLGRRAGSTSSSTGSPSTASFGPPSTPTGFA